MADKFQAGDVLVDKHNEEHYVIANVGDSELSLQFVRHNRTKSLAISVIEEQLSKGIVLHFREVI